MLSVFYIYIFGLKGLGVSSIQKLSATNGAIKRHYYNFDKMRSFLDLSRLFAIRLYELHKVVIKSIHQLLYIPYRHSARSIQKCGKTSQINL